MKNSIQKINILKITKACFLILPMLLISCNLINNEKEKVNTEISSGLNLKINANIVLNSIECYNRKDWIGMAKHYNDTIDFFYPAYFNKPYKRTKLEFLESVQNYHDSIQVSKIKVKHLYMYKNKIIVESIYSEIDSNGNYDSIPTCSVFTFKDERIIGETVYYND